MYQCMLDMTNQNKGFDSDFLFHYFVSVVELDADVAAVERGQTTEAYRVTQSLQKLDRATMTHPDTFTHCHE